MVGTTIVQSTPFWELLLIACAAAAFGLLPYTIAWWRNRGKDKREEDRREDFMFGYVDGQGIEHKGAFDTLTARMAACEDRLTRGGL